MVTAAVVGTAMAGQSAPTARTTAGGQIISCPDVRSALQPLPPELSPEDQALIENDLIQMEDAGRQSEADAQQAVEDEKAADSILQEIVRPLEDTRRAAISDIVSLIGEDAAGSKGLEDLAPCTVSALPGETNPNPIP
jgi:hypothetical protein